MLTEQTIGRGLRLPYGKRTGIEAVDRLAEITVRIISEEAKRLGSSKELMTPEVLQSVTRKVQQVMKEISPPISSPASCSLVQVR